MPVTKEDTYNKVLIKRKVEHGVYPGMVTDTWLEAMDEWAAIKTAERDARVKELEDGLKELTKQYKSDGISYAKQNGLTWEQMVESGLPAYETATQLLNNKNTTHGKEQ